MNRYLDVGIRTTTLAVVVAPFFMWWLFAFSNPYQPTEQCSPGQTDCRVDALDAHQVP